MDEQQAIGELFEAQRPQLRAVALRMLGTGGEAEDAVQEAWLRVSRAGVDGVDNLAAWLTTVVSRIALDMLRARGSRREAGVPPPDVQPADDDPERDAVLADSVGSALLVVLDTLAPAERLAFVLHDTFAVPFEEIGRVLERSPQAAKQLAHRARRKVQGRGPAGGADPVRRRAVVEAFLAASRGGDFDALLALLHPDVALVADDAAVAMGSPGSVEGAQAVAGVFNGRARAARAALVDDGIGLVWSVEGRVKVVWEFTVTDGTVHAIDMVADPETLAGMRLVSLT